VVFDNQGGQSIRHLQRRSGFHDHGMESAVTIDFATIARGMGCQGIAVRDLEGLRAALDQAAAHQDGPTVIDLKVDKEDLMPGYGAWWDVPQPEVERDGKARPERTDYERKKARQVIR
jgi:TPP-dependent trihydroxycyclohexane-1,2-dione (THcHDO) dehydratase